MSRMPVAFQSKFIAFVADLLHNIPPPLLENTVLKCSEPLPGRSARRRVGLCHRRPWHQSHPVAERTHRLNMSSPSPHTPYTRQRHTKAMFLAVSWHSLRLGRYSRCMEMWRVFSSWCCPISGAMQLCLTATNETPALMPLTFVGCCNSMQYIFIY